MDAPVCYFFIASFSMAKECRAMHDQNPIEIAFGGRGKQGKSKGITTITRQGTFLQSENICIAKRRQTARKLERKAR